MPDTHTRTKANETKRRLCAQNGDVRRILQTPHGAKSELKCFRGPGSSAACTTAKAPFLNPPFFTHTTTHTHTQSLTHTYTDVVIIRVRFLCPFQRVLTIVTNLQPTHTHIHTLACAHTHTPDTLHSTRTIAHIHSHTHTQPQRIAHMRVGIFLCVLLFACIDVCMEHFSYSESHGASRNFPCHHTGFLFPFFLGGK